MNTKQTAQMDVTEARLRAIADAIQKSLGPGVAFILLTANQGEISGGKVNYIGNSNKDDSIALMREYLARIDGKYVEGNASNH